MVLGKMIGGFFGLMVASPLGMGFWGMLVGVILGGRFDRVMNNFKEGVFFSQQKHACQEIFFAVTFQVMGHIAKSDGRVSQHEIRAAQQIMKQMQMDAAAKKLAVEAFSQGKTSSFNIDQALLRLRQACSRNPALIRMFIDIQVQAAEAEGMVPVRKQQLLQYISEQLNANMHSGYAFFDQFFEQVRQQQNSHYQQQHHYQRQVQPDTSMRLQQAYDLLDVKDTATKDQVKRAYRKQMGANHPDRMVSKGLPEEMIKLATQKTQRIKKAYELICQQKGWK
jgi:DnaJ like chaperone protein